MAVKKTFEFFFSPLLKKFFQDMGRDPNNLEMILLRQKAGQQLKDSTKVIEFPQKESFMKQVEAMKKSGDIVDPNNLKKNDNVLTREMFQDSNLNKVARDRDRAIKAKARIEEKEIEPINERFIDYTIQDIKTKEPVEGMKIANRIIKREGEYKDLTEEQSKRILKETDDYLTGKNKPEDKADGGRIGFRVGKFVLDKVIANLLGNKKKVQQAVDDIFPTGDYKYDADMAADALVENNPQIFKNLLREDLSDEVSSEIYGAVLKPIMSNMAKMRELRKVTRPEKTLQSMKENKTIDMSDPEIADEFTTFMKETDPKGFKKLEQTVELSNFDPKNRKKNAKGGRIGYQEGGGIESRLEQLGGDVTSAEQLLQQINERIQSAESSVPEGGAMQQPGLQQPGLGSLPLGGMLGPTVPSNNFGRSIDTYTPRQMPLDNIKGISSPGGVSAINLADIQPGTQPMLGGIQPKSFDQMTPAEKLKAAQGRNMQQDVKLGPVQDYLNEVIKTKGETNMLYPNLPDRTSALPGSLKASESYQGDGPLLQRQNLQTALPGLFAKGGRAGFYTGGITDVEPSLDDIGHGADAMNARTRLMSPGSQATTSTGLNYLLAEDNDNMRIPFNNGLKVDAPNPRILELMLNEKMSYEDAVKEFEKRQKQQPYIDERMGTGPGPILEAAEGGRIGFKGGGLTPEDYLKVKDMLNHWHDYKKGGGTMSKTNFGIAFFRENNAEGGRIGFSGGGMGRRGFLKMLAGLGGLTAAAKSGMIGLGEGGAKKAITETVKQTAPEGVPPYFLNLVKKIKTMGDDVTAVLAYKDKQKVTKYKDYELTEDLATGEQTIQRMKVLDDGSEAYYGQPLTEETYMSYKPGKGQADETMKGKTPPDEYEEGTALLRSDRQYAGEVVDESATISDDVIKEGTVFEDTIAEFGKADGGRIGFSGGGILRAIIANSAKKKGMSVTDFIKATNYKRLPPEVKMYISPEDFAALKGGQKEMYDNYIDMAKTRLNFQKHVEGGKNTPARELFEGMEKTMDEQSFVPKTVTEKDIGEMELMVKNRFNKDRKDNAQGGLQTMLGE